MHRLLVALVCVVSISCKKPEEPAKPSPAVAPSAGASTKEAVAPSAAPTPSGEPRPEKLPDNAHVELAWFAQDSTATDSDKVWIDVVPNKGVVLAHLAADGKEVPDKALSAIAYRKILDAIDAVKLGKLPPVIVWRPGMPAPKWHYSVSVTLRREGAPPLGYGTSWTDSAETLELLQLRKTIEDECVRAMPLLKKKLGPRG